MKKPIVSDLAAIEESSIKMLVITDFVTGLFLDSSKNTASLVATIIGGAFMNEEQEIVLASFTGEDRFLKASEETNGYLFENKIVKYKGSDYLHLCCLEHKTGHFRYKGLRFEWRYKL